MEPQEFTEQAPGAVVTIPGGWAFVPDPLPPNIPVDVALVRAASAASGALNLLLGQSRVLPNPDLIIAPLRRTEAFLSSRLEGTTAQFRDVLVAEALHEEHPSDQDVAEVLNYLQALHYGKEWLDSGAGLGLALVRGLHGVLLSNVRGQQHHPGTFRSLQVVIGADSRFVPPPPEQVAPLMDNLIDFLRGPVTIEHLVDAAVMHYQFEAIHPFEDGNGRIGRLLIPLFLMSRGIIDQPVLYLSRYFEARRSTYIDLLHRVSTVGDWHAWIHFFLDAVVHEATDANERIRRIIILKERYRQIAVSIRNRVAPLLADLILEQPFVTVARLTEYANATYPTARKAIDAFVAHGVLLPQSRVSGTQVWSAEEILRVIYDVDA